MEVTHIGNRERAGIHSETNRNELTVMELSYCSSTSTCMNTHEPQQPLSAVTSLPCASSLHPFLPSVLSPPLPSLPHPPPPCSPLTLPLLWIRSFRSTPNSLTSVSNCQMASSRSACLKSALRPA